MKLENFVWRRQLSVKDALPGYGDSTIPHSGDALVVHRSQDPRVLILEYEVHGKMILTANSYDNRFISVVTIEDRKIVHWRDYMDSLAAFTAETA
jgi:ketosteroid isomerase-like protein